MHLKTTFVAAHAIPDRAGLGAGLLSSRSSTSCVIGTRLGFYGDNGKENGNSYVGVIYTLLVWNVLQARRTLAQGFL